MDAWVTVPIHSRQLQRLIEQLGRRGGAPDLQQAFADAIELWLAEQSKLQIGGDPSAVHGYQWKTVFLPDGTLLRTVSYHDEQYARVQGSEIIFNGRAVTPNQLAHWAGRGTRNAWNDIYVRRPQDKFYILANGLRRLVRQEGEQANDHAQPACTATSSVLAQNSDPAAVAVANGGANQAVAATLPTPASNILAELVSACAAVLQRTSAPLVVPSSEVVASAPRDCGKGEGWDLPERRKFRFRLEDVAFS